MKPPQKYILSGYEKGRGRGTDKRKKLCGLNALGTDIGGVSQMKSICIRRKQARDMSAIGNECILMAASPEGRWTLNKGRRPCQP